MENSVQISFPLKCLRDRSTLLCLIVALGSPLARADGPARNLAIDVVGSCDKGFECVEYRDAKKSEIGKQICEPQGGAWTQRDCPMKNARAICAMASVRSVWYGAKRPSPSGQKTAGGMTDEAYKQSCATMGGTLEAPDKR